MTTEAIQKRKEVLTGLNSSQAASLHSWFNHEFELQTQQVLAVPAGDALVEARGRLAMLDELRDQLNQVLPPES